ncbi:hypothetical protein LCGC14_0321200 [marine sediment metagenome]|uniref:Type II secretion system protein GspG C-terminal domain-containing protein n=1 Tax=marine sediment metagenome TaxID=412755 RepID=A0A0F9WRC1_9ZZZZ
MNRKLGLLGILIIIPAVIAIVVVTTNDDADTADTNERLKGLAETMVLGPIRKAKEVVLWNDLRTLRAHLELYKLQHHGTYPRTLDLLTQATDANGKPGGIYGPYVTGGLPVNPFTETNDVQTKTKGKGPQAWYYNARTGKIHPNNPEHMDR